MGPERIYVYLQLMIKIGEPLIIPGEIRPICCVEGCTRYVKRHSGKLNKNGIRYERKTKFFKKCHFHLKMQRHGLDCCFVCGWNKDVCDRHRLNGRNPKSDKGYTKRNVISLCPNCHRLVHSGKLNIAVMVTESIKNSDSAHLPVEDVLENKNA